MISDIKIRKARLSDTKVIAGLVDQARPTQPHLDPALVAERFSEVGFLLAEGGGKVVGMLGWQVENLVIRVTDFLLTPDVDRQTAGGALIAAMEEEGATLQAEASVLFLPPHPDPALSAYWEGFGYTQRTVTDLPKSWREVAYEWDDSTDQVMIKQLREDMTRRPI
ncbi:MAG: hypothetical protein RBT47_07260 [Anaerolineae bacterium]|nr:hypothetical protein [Anaerolineae bacterium]